MNDYKGKSLREYGDDLESMKQKLDHLEWRMKEVGLTLDELEEKNRLKKELGLDKGFFRRLFNF